MWRLHPGFFNFYDNKNREEAFTVIPAMDGLVKRKVSLSNYQQFRLILVVFMFFHFSHFFQIFNFFNFFRIF